MKPVRAAKPVTSEPDSSTDPHAESSERWAEKSAAVAKSDTSSREAASGARAEAESEAKFDIIQTEAVAEIEWKK